VEGEGDGVRRGCEYGCGLEVVMVFVERGRVILPRNEKILYETGRYYYHFKG
jgi:hypothetical protein